MLVAGPPAVGKSTLISVWAEELREKKVNFRFIDDFQVLLNICPPGANSNEYFYNEGGALVLHDESREAVMARQYQELERLWREDFDGVTILEISNPDLRSVAEKHFCGLPESVLLTIQSNMDEIRSRNMARSTERRIPEAFMSMFKEGSPTVEGLGQNFSRVESVGNYGTLDEFVAKSKELATNFFEE